MTLHSSTDTWKSRIDKKWVAGAAVKLLLGIFAAPTGVSGYESQICFWFRFPADTHPRR